MVKVTSILIILVSLLYGLQGKAQMVINVINPEEILKSDPIDNVLFTAQYQTSFVPDASNPEKRKEETMMLKVGNKASVYYSYAKFLTDSVIEEDKKNGVSQEVMIEHLQQFSGVINYKIYKNYPSRKITTLEPIAASRFKCVEENERPNWQLKSDTMTILSYHCQKAVCHFKGRDYEAWFTPEIPRSEGPWKLQGLPGLILRAKDSKEHYIFDCIGITQNKTDDTIQYSDHGHEPVSRKNLNKLQERFAADPVGYIASTNPHVKVTIMDNSGRPTKNPKDTPYNPIELED